MTPKYLNGFKYVAFAGHSAAPPASLSPDDALRKLKYVRHIMPLILFLT
jgi:hypothetical protein